MLADLHPGQWRVVRGARRFNVVNCGRRWGKTVLGIDLAMDAALDGKKVAYYEPNYPMLAEVWREFLLRLPPPIGKPSAQEHRIDLAGGGLIDLWSLEAADSSRGRAYHRVIVDEAAKSDNLMAAWQHVIRPTLTDHRGDAWFLSTPRGFNAFEVLYGWGQDRERPEWTAWTAPTSDNPHIAADEIEAARRDLDPLVFGQEFLADFLSAARSVFPGVTLAERDPIPTPEYLPPETITYRLPAASARYLIGADVAEGLAHGDRSCASVVQLDDLGRGSEAAHLCGTFEPELFALQLDALGLAYGGRLGVERNGPGVAVLQKLRSLVAERVARGDHQPYSLYHHVEPGRDPVQAGQVLPPAHLAGWRTTAASKPVLVQELGEALRTDLLAIHTPALLQELRAYQYDDFGRTSAPSGQHDDRVIALGISWAMRHAYTLIPRPAPRPIAYKRDGRDAVQDRLRRAFFGNVVAG